MKYLLLAVFTLVFQNAAPQSGDATVAQFNRAVELQRQNQFEAAANAYRALIAARPDYMEAQANLGVVLARLGRYDEAVKAYGAALRLAPNLTPLLLNLGIAHYRAGQFDEAADVFTKVLSVAPDALQARQLLGLSLVELGRDKEATESLERSLAESPDDPAILYGLGLVYLRLNRPELRAVIERLAATPAGLPASHLLRGQSYLARFEYERALPELEAALKLNPLLPRLQYSLGICYFGLHRQREAIAALETELRRTPKDFSTIYYLAYLHEAIGDIATAQQQVAAALALEPKSPEANALLGKILIRQGKTAEALAPLESAVAVDPLDSDKRYQLGRVYQQLGRRADAAREFAEVQRLKAAQLKTDRQRTPQP